MAKTERKAIDKVLIFLGLITTVVLLAFSGIAYWGYNFASDHVKTELVSQKIFFPPKGSPALDPETYPGLQQYAGQQVDSGAKAKAYANEFIGKHLEEIAGGQTYAEVASASLANPTDQKLAGQKAALFQGETLRGLLLNAYAFDTFANLTLYAAVVSLIGAVVMFLLVLAGLGHLTRLK